MNGKQLQVNQTKQMICNALLAIMKIKAYTGISVTDIIEESQTSRRTFYRHFHSKTDLLHFYFQNFVDDYLSQKSHSESSDLENSLLDSFTFWYRHRQSVKLIIDNQLFHLFMIHWNDRVLEIAQTIYGKGYTAANTKEATYILRYSIGGFYNILWEWLKKDCPEPPEVIVNYYQKMLKNINTI